MTTLLAVVALASLAAAGALLVYVAQLRRDEHERSRARVAALSAAAAQDDAAASGDAASGSVSCPETIAPYSPSGGAVALRRPLENTFTSGSVFAERTAEGAVVGEWRRFGAAAAAAAGIAALALALTAAGSGNEAATSSSAADEGPVPLELTVLAHDRQGSSLAVRGEVSVPAALAGARIEALIQVFDEEGRELGRVRAATSPAAVDAPPHSDAARTHAFEASIPGASGVGRYRIRFQQGERVLPHIDGRASGGPLSARR